MGLNNWWGYTLVVDLILGLFTATDFAIIPLALFVYCLEALHIDIDYQAQIE
jgi:hypothetical protein